uniref:Secreted peptide n=1 Tax=Rhizochromulina marina TaxID=1034831 RepID=A0A7S2W7F2_9STRA|mmetsp:Transcript_17157/g.49972  ORF Transcript_17157/g.49972 Transcript_17157/m.49972 type:complete len:107 (+) Transcript_17157:1980-2300(+)
MSVLFRLASHVYCAVVLALLSPSTSMFFVTTCAVGAPTHPPGLLGPSAPPHSAERPPMPSPRLDEPHPAFSPSLCASSSFVLLPPLLLFSVLLLSSIRFSCPYLYL